MRNIINKITSLLVLFPMVFNLFCFSPIYAERTSENTRNGKDCYEFLRAVGVLEENVSYNADAKVSRAYFAKLTLNLCGIYLNAGDYTETVFTDVTKKTEYSEYISEVYRLGYISGAGGANFNPSEQITAAEAIVILSRVLGYSELAEREGGYPYGYISLAKKHGVLDGVEISYNDAVNFENAMQLLRNAADADLLEYEIRGNGEYKIVQDEDATILTKYLKIYNAEGVVTANEHTGLMAETSSVGENQVAMSEYIFDCGNTDVYDCLGYRMKLYYDGSDDTVKAPRILYAESCRENTVNTFDTRDITVSGEYIKYAPEDKTAKKYRVDDYASFILNGKMTAMTLDELETLGKGTVTLISNDGDGTAEVVIIYDYDTYVVSGVSGISNIVTSKEGDTISLEENNDLSVRVMKDGRNISPADINVNDTILVAKSRGNGKNLKTVLVSDKIAVGTVDFTDEEYISVDDIRYKADAGALSSVGSGKEYKIYIDALGYAVRAESENDLVYGFLYYMAKTEAEEEVVCRIFTENNRWVRLKLAEKIKFNGISKKTEDLYDEFGREKDVYRQLIRYSVNADNDVMRIDTAEYIPIGSDAESSAVKGDVFRKTFSSSLQYRPLSKTFDGKVAVNQNTKIFVVPPDYNEDMFEVITISDLVQDKKYTFDAYDTDELLIAGAVVMGSSEEAVSASTNFIIVKNIVSMLDYDDNPVPGIKGYFMGHELTLPVRVGVELKESDVRKLKKGDVIQVLFDKKGDVSDILQHKPDQNNHYLYNSFYNTFTVIGGIVTKCDAQNQMLRLNYGQNLTGVIALNSPKVYIYEADDDTCTEGTVADIVQNDVIIAKMQHIRCNEIVVIR